MAAWQRLGNIGRPSASPWSIRSVVPDQTGDRLGWEMQLWSTIFLMAALKVPPWLLFFPWRSRLREKLAVGRRSRGRLTYRTSDAHPRMKDCDPHPFDAEWEACHHHTGHAADPRANRQGGRRGGVIQPVTLGFLASSTVFLRHVTCQCPELRRSASSGLMLLKSFTTEKRKKEET
ncbi:hypothetical protein BO94DRAFT_135217 [Aspergillus sclerotioniger CBS 115572]|uniref:Uncharacterized protein n=1 Tax=Aspergillus sclerotioniger CBS 115572 TaxID=1450535 RepID=A0A317XDF0_9EURO|nr:hypothetical protein BO94DRAFT_135217 [Aspergillus sclerotioniger CBS 115572]PWY95742.1 hypothetical protein BO94DRAFT_135217 [Aspergillus sclerotioniger CBS 115572]